MACFTKHLKKAKLTNLHTHTHKKKRDFPRFHENERKELVLNRFFFPTAFCKYWPLVFGAWPLAVSPEPRVRGSLFASEAAVVNSTPLFSFTREHTTQSSRKPAKKNKSK